MNITIKNVFFHLKGKHVARFNRFGVGVGNVENSQPSGGLGVGGREGWKASSAGEGFVGLLDDPETPEPRKRPPSG